MDRKAPEGKNNGIDYDGDYRPYFHGFYDLMKFKVTKILLVSSLYDAFTLEEDGLLTEQISGEYHEFALSTPPQVIRVSSGEDALKEMRRGNYDMIVTMARLADMDPYQFGLKAKELQPGITVVLLLTDRGDLKTFRRLGKRNSIDKVFYWSGDSTLFLALTKYVEDKINVQPDTDKGVVDVILVVEDSPRYYSMFLPIIYTEVMNQTGTLIAEGLNEQEKFFRKKARPKILLAENYEEAMDYYEKYRHHIIGVITDVSYGREGARVPDAGFQLIQEIDKDIPVLLQSSHSEHREKADSLGIPFLDKASDTLLQDLKGFFRDYLGFGDFVFKIPGGEEVGRASDMREFIDIVKEVSIESIRFHGSTHQFSSWIRARGEYSLAIKLRTKQVSDFRDAEEMRRFLIDAFRESRKAKQQGVITDFPQQDFEFDGTFTRLGSGSLGGKGRGLAFLGALLNQSNIQYEISNCSVGIPDTLVMGTDEFDRFMEENKLHTAVSNELTDPEIAARFLKARISEDIRRSLRTYLSRVTWPIAVRSSSLLEDSQNQPFAGIYSTYILPNNCGDDDTRLEQLCQAIKLVYASTYKSSARAYIQTTVHMAEEEKMAIVIQKLVGNAFGDRFYPMFSGVIQSYNFYPISPLKREDGIVSLALGLGKAVVEGERVLSFSPKHPSVLPGLSTPEDALKNSQESFYALNVEQTCFDLSMGEDVTLLNLDITGAEGDGMLDMLASTYDANDNRIRDGLSGPGPRIITFAGILKYNMVPLVDITRSLIEIGEKGMGRPVEIEFAASMDDNGRPEFHILQIRPLVTRREHSVVHVSENETEGSLIYTTKALGNGILDDVSDVVFIPPELFDTTRTVEIAREIGKVNAEIGAPYILIGPGRWGTQDRFLGIPVEWDQISWVKAMVEVSLEGFRVDPSHGTHFFHNITSLGIMYFTVPYGRSDSSIDWEMLTSMKPTTSMNYVRHVHFAEPFDIRVDGRSGRGVIKQEIKSD